MTKPKNKSAVALANRRWAKATPEDKHKHTQNMREAKARKALGNKG